MPGPLLPLLAGTIGRLVTANVGRSVAGALSRATATRGAAIGVNAQPGNAKSAAGAVIQYARQKLARSASRSRLQFARNTPGLAQAHKWKKVKQAFGQINKAREKRLRGIMTGNAGMIDQAKEDEAAAKEKLAKASKELLASFSGLKRGFIGLVIALHTVPAAVQALARARVDSFRATGMYAGNTASALAKYDVNERLNKISSAKFTSGSDTRLIEATQSLNNELKPLKDSLNVLTNEGIVLLVRGTTSLISVMKTFSPLISAVEKLAKHFADKNTGGKDVTIEMMQGFVDETRKQVGRAKQAMDKEKLPAGFPGGFPGGQP